MRLLFVDARNHVADTDHDIVPDLQILVLAVVQGLTDFLPISSSGHLILAPHLFGFSDQGLAFDVAVHLGSLIAVVGYFRHDVLRIALGWFGSLVPGNAVTSDARLGWAIIVGTLPVVVAGRMAAAGDDDGQVVR